MKRGTFLKVPWSAPAERSGDGAFVRAGRKQTSKGLRAHESGVALRFPPQSKTLRARRAGVICACVSADGGEAANVSQNRLTDILQTFDPCLTTSSRCQS